MANRVLVPRAWLGVVGLMVVLLPARAWGQLKVGEVRFEGNRSYSTAALRKVTRVEDRSWLGLLKPRFNYLVAGRDAAFLKAFYHNRGYLQAQVEQRTERVSERELAVTFVIREGPLTTLADVYFEGNDDVGPQRLLNLIDRRRASRLRPNTGEPMNASAIQDAANVILSHYREEGYYFAQVRPVIGARDSTTGTAPVRFRIREGPKVRVSRVTIDGARNTKDFVITREITLDPGDLLTEPERRKSQRRLHATGIFRTVNVTVGEISPDSTQAVVQVTVSERPRRYVGLGAGFARDENAQVDLRLRAAGEWGHRNLFGTGRAIALSAAGDFQVITDWQPIQQEISLRYVEPWFWGSRTPLTALFALRPQQYDVYQVQELAVELGLRREFTPRTVGWLNFSYRLVSTEFAVENVSDQKALRGITGEIQRDSRDTFVSPSRGSLTRLRTRNYGWILGGPDYDRFTWEWARYRATGRRTIFASRIKVGMASPRGGTKDIPVFDRFFAGGASTVRGYDERTLGPVRATTDTVSGARRFDPVGGRILALLNLEFRRPRVAGPLGTHLFLDAGNVWSRLKDVDGRIAFSAGIGVFLDTPVGPIRFDYAWRLNRSPAERDLPGYRLPASNWHLTILHAF